jgi:hypothetical protein
VLRGVGAFVTPERRPGEPSGRERIEID